jgi:hypothetical protein
VRCAQRGGVGVVVYCAFSFPLPSLSGRRLTFLTVNDGNAVRKEGRALGEVTKYLVYNARKRGGDNATDYFRRTEDIAGVKGMFFFRLPALPFLSSFPLSSLAG